MGHLDKVKRECVLIVDFPKNKHALKQMFTKIILITYALLDFIKKDVEVVKGKNN
jgi:hypothetical protein